MARVSYKVTRQVVTVDKVGQPGPTSFLLGGNGTPTAVPSTVAVAADVATLVADGATPTQAHVTTLNTDWGTLNTALAAMVPETGDVYVSFDATKITTRRQLREALEQVLIQATGSGTVTA